MTNYQVIYLLIVIMCNLCSAYKILLVFPIPGKSHTILGEALVKILLKAGHEVTYVTPVFIQNVPEKLRQIDVSSNFEVLPIEQVLNIEKLMTKEVDMTEMSAVFEMMNKVANNTLMDNNLQNLLHEPETIFDAVIIEWMYTELYAGFASVFNCPMIWFSSMEPHYLVLSLIDEDVNPTYTADIFTITSPPYSFVQRMSKLWSYCTTRYKKWLMSGIETEIYEKAYSSAVAKKGRLLPSYSELIYNGSLMLGNSHVSAGQSLRLPQNYIPIGGYHIDSDDVKPLPKDLKNIMDKAKHGVIYFSMGSLLKGKQVPNKIKRGILDVFAGLKQSVIWKFEEPLLNTSKNLHIVNWAPQQSILAHPKCVLFITHGGLLSITETLHFGVPIIGIPMFADQFNNVNRAVFKGFGKRVDLNVETPVNLKAAIKEILSDSRYRDRVKELSFVYHHRPVSPSMESVHWVEHVVRTRGAPHLRSPAFLLPWYQKMYLDLLGLVIAILLIVIAVLKFCLFASKISVTQKQKKN